MKNGIAAMDYASQNKSTVRFSVSDNNYETETVTKSVERDVLSMTMKQKRKFFSHFDEGSQLKVFAHFEISHWYFWRLHCAISCADDHLISRLVRPKLRQAKSRKAVSVRNSTYTLDQEYQLPALKKMLSCKISTPYLLLGPFGTGKTHVLAAAIEQFLKNPQNRIIVCTHQNTGADKLYLSLQENMHAVQTAKSVLRVVPDDSIMFRTQHSLYHPSSCKTVHSISIRRLSKWPVIITTFSTALTIKDKLLQEGGKLHFSNIIMDEGAQSREPEALGALVLADSDTRIIIAGDHQQVQYYSYAYTCM